ncbi:MAG: GGDEF domain-containing protein [Verrucomicrobiota bacterium]
MKLPEPHIILMATEQAMQGESWEKSLTAFSLDILDTCPEHPWLFLDWSEAETRVSGSAFDERVIDQALLKLSAFIPADISDQIRGLHAVPHRAVELAADDDLAFSPIVHAGICIGALVRPNRTDEAQATFYTCLERCLKLLFLHFARLAANRDVDPLTRLPGRNAFDRAFQQAIELHKRHAVPFCLAILDVDEFKSVNDRYGHAAGDELLQKLGQHLAVETRTTDTACRLGGDEFGMVLPYANQAAGVFFAKRMLEGIHRIKRADGSALRVSMGIISSQDRDDLCDETLRANADRAMYAAKAAGGGTFKMDPGS